MVITFHTYILLSAYRRGAGTTNPITHHANSAVLDQWNGHNSVHSDIKCMGCRGCRAYFQFLHPLLTLFIKFLKKNKKGLQPLQPCDRGCNPLMLNKTDENHSHLAHISHDEIPNPLIFVLLYVERKE